MVVREEETINYVFKGIEWKPRSFGQEGRSHVPDRLLIASAKPCNLHASAHHGAKKEGRQSHLYSNPYSKTWRLPMSRHVHGSRDQLKCG